MNEALILVLAGGAGGVLGAFFFGSLWWTARMIASSRRPVLLFVGSATLRLGIALAGFYWLASGHWERLLSSVLGFFIARLVVTWLTRPSAEAPTWPAREARHAPQPR